MKEQLTKAMKLNYLLAVVYMDKSGKLTKRRIKVLKMHGEKIWVWDAGKRAKRTFLIDRVLACQPILRKEREII